METLGITVSTLSVIVLLESLLSTFKFPAASENLPLAIATTASIVLLGEGVNTAL
jgi:hypothetical protein